jgi:hypothetical protein
MNFVGALILLCVLTVIMKGTRQRALAAAMVGVLYLTQGQNLVIFGLNFYATRIIGFALLGRVLLRKEFSFSKLTTIDRALLILYGYSTLIFLLRSQVGQFACIAEALDAICCYFGFRGLIVDEEDVFGLLRTLTFLLIPYACILAVERNTGSNPFSFMGGVIEGGFVRNGKPRCMGSFRYAVTLGTFAGTFLSLYIGMYLSKVNRRLAGIGIVLCLWIVWMANSGGSFSATLVALLGWVFWKIRAKMRVVRWGIAALLLVLSFTMTAPIWFIFERASAITGGDGWHRSYLIDVALRNITHWWLWGMPIEDTADWFPYTINGGADLTNQYLVFAINAGVGSLVLFIILISRVFKSIGMAAAELNSDSARYKAVTLILWGLGGAMAAHVSNLFGVTYFDQMSVVWFLQLAAVASVTSRVRQHCSSELEQSQKSEAPIKPTIYPTGYPI